MTVDFGRVQNLNGNLLFPNNKFQTSVSSSIGRNFLNNLVFQFKLMHCLVVVVFLRAMMMTACDLNGTTKPWEIQKEVRWLSYVSD